MKENQIPCSVFEIKLTGNNFSTSEISEVHSSKPDKPLEITS